MNKIKKILFTLILSALFIVNVDAAVKESGEYDVDTYIIGITRFDNGVIINDEKITVAKDNFETFIKSLDQGLPEIISIDIYYYSALTKKWYYFESDKTFTKLNETDSKKFASDLDIFYVNNEEKQLELNYDGNVDENSISNKKVKFENNKFIIPATVLEFNFTSNNNNLNVETKTNENNKKEYGKYYIPLYINVYDEQNNLILAVPTNYDGLIVTDNLFKNYEKDAYKLTYVDDKGEVDFTKKVTDSNYKIYQKYIPVGYIIENENMKFDKETLIGTYTGNIEVDSIGNYITFTIKAPEGLDLDKVLVNGNAYSWHNNELDFDIDIENDDLTDRIITIKWNDETTVNYTIKFSNNKFNRLVEYYDENGAFLTEESVEDGAIIKGVNANKTGYTFLGYTLSFDSEELFDTTKGITKDTKLYLKYYESPIVSYNNSYNLLLGEEQNITAELIANGLLNKNFKLTAKFADDVEFDENNYVKIKVGENYELLKDIEFTNVSDLTNLDLLVKVSNENYKKVTYVITYNATETVVTIDNKLITNEDVYFAVNNHYYKESEFEKALSESNENNYVVLEKDATLSSRIEITSGKVYLDLNSHSLTNLNNTDTFLLNNTDSEVELNIKNGTLIVKRDSIDSNLFVFAIRNGIKGAKNKVTTNLENVNIKSDDNGVFVLSEDSNLTITNGEITSKNYAISGNGSKGNKSTVNITGVTILSKSIAIYHPELGELTIDKSSVSGLTAISLKSGILNLSESKLVGTKKPLETPEVNNNGTSVTGDALYIEVNPGYQSVSNGLSTIGVNILGKLNVFETVDENAYSIRIFNPKKIDGTTLNIEDDFSVIGEIVNENETGYRK